MPSPATAEAQPPAPADLPASFFHVGIVVDDIEKAIARYSTVFGISFSEPETAVIPYMADPEPVDGPVEQIVAFAHTAPPFYQLIQARPSGIFSSANADRVLYYGYWEPDMVGRIARLDHLGLRIDARMAASADAVPYAVITAPDVLGMRVQYVNPALHPSLYDEDAASGEADAPPATGDPEAPTASAPGTHLGSEDVNDQPTP
jgi:catechol 2,3-dioxygenase-like lactoylglutathione lyase family enzyme